jgi:hypothetical protein
VAGVTGTPVKDRGDQDVFDILGNTQSLARNIRNELSPKLNGVIYSPDGAKRSIGHSDDIESIVAYLTQSNKGQKPQRKNRELVNIIANTINSKFISRLTDESRSTMEDMYPNLYGASVRSPVKTRSARSKSAATQQFGSGRILKIYFNKWNQLLA